MSNNLKDGVLREDIGHPEFHPDRDLVDDLMSVVNRNAARLTVGNIVGSLLVVMRATLFSRTWSGRQITLGQVRAVCLMASKYLAKSPRADSGLELRQH